jgi:hypothetical protein
MSVTGQDRSTRNVPVPLEWNMNLELRRESPECAALCSGCSNSGTIITVCDTAPRRPSHIYSDQQECTHQE